LLKINVVCRGASGAVVPCRAAATRQTLTDTAGIIRRRKQIGSPWRKLAPGQQALLVLAYLRNGETFADLAAGFGIGTATAWRYVTQTVGPLAAPLRQTAYGAARRQGGRACLEHRDRLGRVNTELVESALWAHGRRLVVLDDGEVADDLVREMVEVLTGFCARLYGRRSARNRALKAVGCAQRDIGPQAAVGAAGHDAQS
jgi:hypothetical protein